MNNKILPVLRLGSSKFLRLLKMGEFLVIYIRDLNSHQFAFSYYVSSLYIKSLS